MLPAAGNDQDSPENIQNQSPATANDQDSPETTENQPQLPADNREDDSGSESDPPVDSSTRRAVVKRKKKLNKPDKKKKRRDPLLIQKEDKGKGYKKRSGYKGTIDWQDINSRIAKQADDELNEALAANDVAKIETARAKAVKAEPSKKDHACELIWWNFRDFIFTHCGRSLKPLYEEMKILLIRSI